MKILQARLYVSDHERSEICMGVWIILMNEICTGGPRAHKDRER